MILDDLQLNERAADLADELLQDPDAANIEVHDVEGACVIDCGIHTPGGLLAARSVAEICLADLADVDFSIGRLGERPCGLVSVEMDDPAVACLLSQYAGWKIELKNYFAIGSGPMRALRAQEELFTKLDYAEEADVAVGVLETSSLPDEAVVEYIAEQTGIDPDGLTLLIAPTASLAGAFQVVSRSVETCLHKLFELGFDVMSIRAAIGSALLPPLPKDDVTAIGRSNDSILYGSEVLLWVEGDDATIQRIGAQTPASTSRDYGEPFAAIFRRYDGDFYKIDPLLFSPAVIVINNLSTGSCFQFGKTNPAVLERSFYGEG